MIRNSKNIIKRILQRFNNRNHKINYTSTCDNNNYLYNLNHILDLEQNFKGTNDFLKKALPSLEVEHL